MNTLAKHVLIQALFLFLLLGLCGQSVAQMLSVSGENVNLRSGPGRNYPVKWEYGKGFPLKVIEKKGQWVKVSDFERDSGWVHNTLLSESPHLIVKVNRGSKKKINIRSGPSTSKTVVGQAYYGVVFETLEKKNGWARVRHDSGLEGWIKLTLLWGF